MKRRFDQFFLLVLSTACWFAAPAGWAASSAPVITNSPASQTVLLGSPVAFTVGVSGTAPLSYQWRRGGTSIVGATNSTYTIAATANSQTATGLDLATTGSGSSMSRGSMSRNDDMRGR